MKLRKTEKNLSTAAAKAGMDEKTARKWARSTKLPSQCKRERHWRTRPDPFEQVWPELEIILKRSPTVEVKSLFDYLCRKYEGRFQEGQLRTLQRKVKRWRARQGEPKEVMFAQRHLPGHQSQSDYTYMGGLGVSIAGQRFDHLFYHFVLTYSNWETGSICYSESLESLSAGLQNALWELGAVPREHRTDRLSAAVRKLKNPERFTARYRKLLEHYRMQATYSQSGKAHENGDVEQAHHRFKKAVQQELILRGHSDFASLKKYEEFLRAILRRRNASRESKLEQELKVMRRLPPRRLEDFTRLRTRVSRGSLITVRHNTYSVDSRLIREWVDVRIYADYLELWYGGSKVEQIARLRGEGKHTIQYRHIIDSLVKKPGAFPRYRYHQDLFPGLLFRVAYDELRRQCPESADRQYLQILKWAADINEQRVEEAITQLIKRGDCIRADRVYQLLSEVQPTEKWDVHIPPVNLAAYDCLLAGSGEVAP